MPDYENKTSYTPLGVIHSKPITTDQMPIQPVYAKGCEDQAEIHPEFAEGLCNLEGFSHIGLI